MKQEREVLAFLLGSILETVNAARRARAGGIDENAADLMVSVPEATLLNWANQAGVVFAEAVSGKVHVDQGAVPPIPVE